MDTTVKALKNLYVALGGDVDDVAEISRIPDMIKVLSVTFPQVISSILPAITAGDNGKVLTALDGSWRAMDIPAELPQVTGIDEGDTLEVVNGQWTTVSHPEVKEITADNWQMIVNKIANGTATYRIGNYKPLDLGDEGTINMQIVAKGSSASPLASGNGYATYDLVAMEPLNTQKKMNSSASASGGWANSELRTYLRETIKPLIPQVVREAIKEVKKYTSKDDVETTEDIWLPSSREIKSWDIFAQEKAGPTYSYIYKDNESCIKSIDDTAVDWWLRTFYNTLYNKSFYSIPANGSGIQQATGNYNKGVVIGFSL